MEDGIITATFYNDTGEPFVITEDGRTFKPWIGGESGPWREYKHGQYVGALYDYSQGMETLYPRDASISDNFE